MRLQRTKWVVAVVTCSLIALGAVGCGDDDDDNQPGDGGSGEGGAGGKGGSGGKGGAGGKGGTGGASGAGAPTVAECTTSTTALGVSADCASCACEKGLAAANKCTATPACWGLIECVGAMCADPFNCAVCTDQYPGASVLAAPLAPTLQGECASVCVAAPPTDDGGSDDAGL